jgi:hypothetical protein
MFLWDLVQLVVLVLFTLIVLTGWGRIGMWALRIDIPRGINVYICWLGFSMLIGFLEIIHLFFAINWKVTLLVSVIGIVGLISLDFKCLISQVFLLLKKSTLFIRIFLIIGILFFILFCLRSMGFVNNYDSGIYHFGSIRWVNEYPIVPGLGNVFTALAYNQSYFLYLGLLNIAPYWNHGYAAGSLVLLSLTGLTLAQFCIKSPASLRLAFGIPIFIFLGYLGGTLSNPSPDTAVSLLQIVMFLLLVTLSHSYAIKNDQKQLLLCTLIILSITVVTIKVSSAMFALLTLGLALYFAHQGFFRKGEWKPLLFIGLIFGLIHLIRGYLLSGAPLYPSEFGSILTLPWAMSPDSISGERFWIYVWSRLPGAKPAEVIGSWAWFPFWLSALSYDVWIFFIVLVVLLCINIWLLYINRNYLLTYKFLMLGLPIIGSMFFWFVSAPQVRFLGAIPFLLLSLNIWICSDLILFKYNLDKKIKIKYYYLFKVFLIFSTCLMSMKLIGLRSISLEGWTPLPSVGIKTKITRTGIIINIPSEGNQCWNAILPCSPQVVDELDVMQWPKASVIFELIPKRPIYRLKY